MNSYVHFNLLTPLLFLIPVVIHIIIDYRYISTHNHSITKLGYWTRNMLTGSGILLAALINKLWIEPAPYYGTGVAFCFALFLALFDYGINLSRGKRWYYVSSDVNHHSYWERIRQKITPLAELILKIFLLGCGIASYYQYTFL